MEYVFCGLDKCAGAVKIINYPSLIKPKNVFCLNRIGATGQIHFTLSLKPDLTQK